eukprot:1918070-Pleurochrysis_carterae.AAC.1
MPCNSSAILTLRNACSLHELLIKASMPVGRPPPLSGVLGAEGIWFKPVLPTMRGEGAWAV